MSEELCLQIEKIKAKGFADMGYSIGNGICWAGFWIGFAILFSK